MDEMEKDWSQNGSGMEIIRNGIEMSWKGHKNGMGTEMEMEQKQNGNGMGMEMKT